MLNFGIIGAGRVAHAHASALHVIENAKLKWVIDLDEKRATTFGKQYGCNASARVDDLLNTHVDAVLICTPTFYHSEHTIKSLEAGKHVLCEKPIASDLEQAGEMITTAMQSRKIFMVGHVLRFWPEYAYIRSIVRKGEFGEPLTLYGARLSGSAGGSWEKWLLSEKEGLGVLDPHIHDLDYANWMFNKVVSVFSKGVKASNGILTHISTFISYQKGHYALLEGSFQVPSNHPFTMNLRVICEKGTFNLVYHGNSYDEGTTNLVEYHSEKGVSQKTIDAEDPYTDQLRYFLKCIMDGNNPEIGNPADAKNALKIALLTKQSMEKNKPINL